MSLDTIPRGTVLPRGRSSFSAYGNLSCHQTSRQRWPQGTSVPSSFASCTGPTGVFGWGAGSGEDGNINRVNTSNTSFLKLHSIKYRPLNFVYFWLILAFYWNTFFYVKWDQLVIFHTYLSIWQWIRNPGILFFIDSDTCSRTWVGFLMSPDLPFWVMKGLNLKLSKPSSSYQLGFEEQARRDNVLPAPPPPL